jgi:endonuclease VIII
MPEGDTIFRTARALGRALGGREVIAFRSTYPTLTRFHEDAPITGRTVERVEARGKWLLIHFSGGATLATHMLMSGSWHIYRPGERWQQPRQDLRIAIENAEFIAVGFKVPVAEMHTAQSLKRAVKIPPPETDVLGKAFDAGEAVRKMRERAGDEIADVLLDQKVLAGVGNVFKSEICFVCGIHPFSRIETLSNESLTALVRAARKLVGANVLEDSGNTIVTYGGRGRRTTHESDPGASLWVYGRAGQPCRKCGEDIECRLQGPNARVSFWCPQCQGLGDRE